MRKNPVPLVTDRCGCGAHPNATKKRRPMNKKKCTPAACSGTKRHRQTCFGHSEEKGPRSSAPKKKQSMKQDDTVMPSPKAAQNSAPEQGDSPKSEYKRTLYWNRPLVQPYPLHAAAGRAFAGERRRKLGLPAPGKAFIAQNGSGQSVAMKFGFPTLRITVDPWRPAYTGKKKSLPFYTPADTNRNHFRKARITFRLKRATGEAYFSPSIMEVGLWML